MLALADRLDDVERLDGTTRSSSRSFGLTAFPPEAEPFLNLVVADGTPRIEIRYSTLNLTELPLLKCYVSGNCLCGEEQLRTPGRLCQQIKAFLSFGVGANGERLTYARVQLYTCSCTCATAVLVTGPSACSRLRAQSSTLPPYRYRVPADEDVYSPLWSNARTPLSGNSIVQRRSCATGGSRSIRRLAECSS
jgi:hypothetical protein